MYCAARADAPTYRYVGAEARTLDGGWESLGDMGWFDEDGYLYLGDRMQDMILSGGANVYPAEVEAALAGAPGGALGVRDRPARRGPRQRRPRHRRGRPARRSDCHRAAVRRASASPRTSCPDGSRSSTSRCATTCRQSSALGAAGRAARQAGLTAARPG